MPSKLLLFVVLHSLNITQTSAQITQIFSLCGNPTHHCIQRWETEWHEIICSPRGTRTPSKRSSWSWSAPRVWARLQQTDALEALPHHLKRLQAPPTNCIKRTPAERCDLSARYHQPCTRSWLSCIISSFCPLIEALPRCRTDWTLHILSWRKTSCGRNSSSLSQVSTLSQSLWPLMPLGFINVRPKYAVILYYCVQTKNCLGFL